MLQGSVKFRERLGVVLAGAVIHRLTIPFARSGRSVAAGPG